MFRRVFQQLNNKRSYFTNNKFLNTNNNKMRNILFGTTILSGTWFSGSSATSNVPTAGLPGTNNERTFIAIKPDGVQRKIIGEVIKRFEAKGFRLVGLKLLQPTEELASEHYKDLSKKPFFGGLVKYFSSGPIVAMVWEGQGAIKTGRVMLGATKPSDSAPGTIRGDLCIDIGRNIIHGSDSEEAAKHEIEFWFKDNEVVDWGYSDAAWIYEKP